MTTGEGQEPRADREDRKGREGRGDRIGVGGGDDSVVRIQLAARWAEVYAPESDSLASALKRFRAAFDYVDAVIHGVEPPELALEHELSEAAGSAASPPATYTPPSPPAYPPQSSPQPPPTTPQPWT